MGDEKEKTQMLCLCLAPSPINLQVAFKPVVMADIAVASLQPFALIYVNMNITHNNTQAVH
jgi:hypothetical protein